VARAAVKPAPHRRRFRLAYTVLAVVVAVAGVALGYELLPSTSSSARSTSGTWSAWQPQLPGVAAVLDIANHVGPEYRLPNGQQLSRVKAGYPGTAGVIDPSSPAEIRIPVNTIALALTDAAGQTSYEVSPAYPTTIEYQLCGPGHNCQIPPSAGGGTPKVEAALHREALELALYTFRYVPDIGQVVELLPPDAPGGRSRALLLNRGDPNLAASLVQPPSVTLPTPPTAASQRYVNALTSPVLDYAYQQLFDGTYQMVLSIPH
jgi:hypothetical protein